MNPVVTVIGTIFIDCKGFAMNTYRPDGRNVGRIEFVHGGVGRNIAENIANLEVPTQFVSTIDSNGLGKEVLQRLTASKIGTSHIMECANKGMGMWLAILNENGDLSGSISQMPDLSILEGKITKDGNEIVKHSSHIALELDLTDKITKDIIHFSKKHNKPVYGIPGNMEVILNHKDVLNHLTCFICNNHEAERLMETALSGLSVNLMIEQLIKYVDSIGLRSMVVTLGAQGAIYYDSSTGHSGFQSVLPVNMVDSTGAGDAFFSGTVMGLVRYMPLEEAVVCGTKVAAWTIESKESTCLELSSKMEEDIIFQKLLARAK